MPFVRSDAEAKVRREAGSHLQRVAVCGFSMDPHASRFKTSECITQPGSQLNLVLRRTHALSRCGSQHETAKAEDVSSTAPFRCKSVSPTWQTRELQTLTTRERFLFASTQFLRTLVSQSTSTESRGHQWKQMQLEPLPVACLLAEVVFGLVSMR